MTKVATRTIQSRNKNKPKLQQEPKLQLAHTLPNIWLKKVKFRLKSLKQRAINPEGRLVMIMDVKKT